MDSYQKKPSTSKDRDQFPVSVLMRYQASTNNKWSNGQWEASSIVVGDLSATPVDSKQSEQAIRKQAIRSDVDNPETLYSGFTVAIYKDDAESYYHNLMSDNPKAFVICRSDETDSDQIKPVLVTLSYGEATSYMETEELVYSVALPPELYKWLEQFVLEHYVPEKKKKRRRDNWKETSERETVK